MQKLIPVLILSLLFSWISCDNWKEVPTNEIVNKESIFNSDSTEIIFEVALPQQTNTLYLNEAANGFLIAGTENGEIYSSSDGGKNWKLLHNVEYTINCITGYANNIFIGADKGLFQFDKNGGNILTLIEPIDNKGVSTTINNIIITLSGQNIICKAYGCDGTYTVFVKALNANVSWIKKNNIATSEEGQVFECKLVDSRLSDYNEIEVYYNYNDCYYKYFLIKNNVYVYSNTVSDSIRSVALSKSNNNFYFLGTDNGLYKYLSFYSPSYIKYLEGYKISSILYSLYGSIYISTDNGSFYSINEGKTWTKIYFNNDNSTIEKFYEQNNFIYALGTNGKLYFFKDLFINYNRPSLVLFQPQKTETVANNLVLKWYSANLLEDVEICYEMQLSRSNTFDSLIIDKKQYYENSYYLSNLERGKYYWRVRKYSTNYNFIWVTSEFYVE